MEIKKGTLMKVKLLHENAKLPVCQPGSVGFDCFAIEDGLINALERKIIPLGFATEFQEGYVAMLCDRSGLASKGITVLGGIIDPDYRGEWKVILYNTTGQGFSYKAGDKLCQVLFLPIMLPVVERTFQLSETERGTGGLGSTDIVIKEHADIAKHYSGMDCDLANHLWILDYKPHISKIRGWTVAQKQEVMAWAKAWVESGCTKLGDKPEVLR